MAELTQNINYLQPTAFKLVIDRRKYQNLEFFAQTVDIPSISIPAADLPYRRVNAHLAGDKLTFGELSATILLDEDLNSYTEMYNWIERLVEQPYKTRLEAGDTDFSTMADITVSMLSSHNNITKKFRFIDCVPTDIGAFALQASTGDIDYLTFPVTFRFTYFEIV